MRVQVQKKIPLPRRRAAKSSLGNYLEDVFQRYHTADRLARDPLLFLHRYSRPDDIEIAGLFAALLAYGRVDGILASVGRVLDTLGASPAASVRQFRAERDAARFHGFVHRWSRAEDIVALIVVLQRVLARDGSVEALFLRSYAPGKPAAMRDALSGFVGELRALAPRGAAASTRSRGLAFFLPDPASGSACKRLNLYLRWMTRRNDALDRGVWQSVSPADLIMPLDTHVARISRNLGLSSRKSANWKMAEDVTASLRAFSPHDPTRYDFSLCRLGILEACPTRHDVAKCLACELRPACHLYRSLRAATA
ncbi:MAG: TIGR02757 family protein [bacterium]